MEAGDGVLAQEAGDGVASARQGAGASTGKERRGSPGELEGEPGAEHSGCGLEKRFGQWAGSSTGK